MEDRKPLTKWSFKIEGGVSGEIETESSLYVMGVMAIVGRYCENTPATVKIWSPSVIPEYGPYWYTVEDDVHGNPFVYLLGLAAEADK